MTLWILLGREQEMFAMRCIGKNPIGKIRGQVANHEL